MTLVEIAVEVAGWAGASLILLGYLLITAGKLTGQSAAYQWMNVPARRASSSTAGGTAHCHPPR